MRHRLALPLLILLLFAVTLPQAPAAASPEIVPLGPAQAAPRAAYTALFGHVGAGGRARWAQRPFVYDGQSYAPGTVVAPEGIAGGSYDSLVVSGTLAVTPSLALDATGTRVAVFRSTVSDPTYGSAAWELADVRETLDTYLGGALRYDILDEQGLATQDLSPYAILIVPSIRRGNEQDMLAALGPQALSKIDAFVRAGGFLYAQSNGAIVAEAAGVVAAGTVDLTSTLQLAPAALPNTGQLAVLDLASPLTFSWITETLYLLSDPVYSPNSTLQTVTEYTNLDGPNRPAILSGAVGAGQVILVAGHPTAATRRTQVPLFFDAVLWALGHPAELSGDAVQTSNPTLDPHLLPAYEAGVPISATLTFENVWDAPLSDTIITETIAAGFSVDPASFSPTGTIAALPDGRSQVVWNLGDVAPGAYALHFAAHTVAPGIHNQNLTFAAGRASFTFQGRPHAVAHRDFMLQARMPARLQADRDIEADRQYFIPPEGLYLDVGVPIENKEDTLASQVVVTDVVPLIVPLVGLEDQESILGQNDGQTVWMRNEPFFYDETTGAPYLPADGHAVSQTITLADWDGQTRAVFEVPYGTHGTVSLQAVRPLALGNFVTIPITYSNAITLTADHKLLLPAKVLTWTLDLWPGYHYEAPAIRYGIRSRELFGRAVTFAGDPGIASEQVVVSAPGASVYTHLGTTPISARAELASGRVYVPAAPATPAIGYRDLWGRDHTLPLRAAFYDVFSWASCRCGGPGSGEQHAALNVTFGMRADLEGSGRRDRQVLLYPGRLDGADLDIVIKDRNQGNGIPSDQMLIDMGMFRGLGVDIGPRSGDWATSWQSSIIGTRLISVETSTGYDHLLFQHDLPVGGTDVITLAARIQSQGGPPVEGMLKLHDGARFTYRQQAAGPSRYEVYDTHVQGVVAEATRLSIRKQVTPIQVSTYGDEIYYIMTVSDPDEPRSLRRNGPGDPFLQSYGFGNLAATTYVGGREGTQILHSVLEPGESTRIRIEVNNNSGHDLTDVVVAPQPPPGITIEPTYPDLNAVPPPIFGDLPFLYLATIPDAGRAVYYYDLTIDANYSGALGQVLTIPIGFSAAGGAAGLQIPPARIGIVEAGRGATYMSALAETLVLTDTLPSYAQLTGAAVVAASDVAALTDATDVDGRAAVFGSFQEPISYTVDSAGATQFTLPGDALARLYDPVGAHALYVVARATFSPASAGPVSANAGAQVTYADPFGVVWQERSPPVLVEAHGAAVRVSYTCTGVVSGTLALGTDTSSSGDPTQCALVAGTTNQVLLDATVSNLGDYPAQEVAASLTLPPGVTLLSASPEPASASEQTITWQVGDLAPGGTSVICLRVAVPLDPYGTIALGSVARRVTVVSRSDGQFTNSFTNRSIIAQLAGPYTAPVYVSPDQVGAALQLAYACESVTVAGSAPSNECVLQAGATNQVVLTATLRNTGVYRAEGVRLGMTLADGVTVMDAVPTVQVTGALASWDIGDLAAGSQTQLRLTLSVAVDAALGSTPGGSPSLAQILDRSDGAFTDAFSRRAMTVMVGGDYALPVQSLVPPTPRVYHAYLPAMTRQTPRPADLVVTRFTVTPARPAVGQPAQITVEVQNQGDLAAGAFWVDFYIDPRPAPTTAGQRWDTSCGVTPCDGIAWGVSGLKPGERVTLTSTPESYAAAYTSWTGAFRVAGVHDLYIYADSWNGDDRLGGVHEADETNNRAAIQGLFIDGSVSATTQDSQPLPVARPLPGEFAR